MTIPALTAHGATLPGIGFGTSFLGSGARAAVEAAISVGYRHIDTAWKYGSEHAIGAAIHASGVPRSEFFITTKVSHEYLRAADVERSTHESLERLRVEQVDLLLIHWPNPSIPLVETISALAEMKQRGLAKHIGVANFPVRLLDEAIRLSSEPLVTNQIEVHPYLDQTTMLAACRARGLIVTAYCPLARGRVFHDPVLADIAQSRGRTVGQIALRWLVQQGNIVPIPRSSNPARMAENLRVFDFALSDVEMARIAALGRADGRIANPIERVGAWD